jgi:hypothetical protein
LVNQPIGDSLWLSVVTAKPIIDEIASPLAAFTMRLERACRGKIDKLFAALLLLDKIPLKQIFQCGE